MKFPCLIDKYSCKIPITVIVYQEGISEDGEPKIALEFTGKCNYQDSAKNVYTADKQLVQLSAQAYLIGDIAPNIPFISDGEVVIFGEKKRIFKGTKARNPDGTVNYTRLDLI